MTATTIGRQLGCQIFAIDGIQASVRQFRISARLLLLVLVVPERALDGFLLKAS
jgi:hypothetical protein